MPLGFPRPCIVQPKSQCLGVLVLSRLSNGPIRHIACVSRCNASRSDNRGRHGLGADAAHVRSTDPAATPSVAVQLAHAGDCYTKATLFVALLRACGIAARMRLVLLAPAYLRGIAKTGGRPVLHAFTEVLAGDHWLGVDSYLADVQMSLAARIALIQDGAQLGWSLHLRGQVAWDGKTSSFGSGVLHSMND